MNLDKLPEIADPSPANAEITAPSEPLQGAGFGVRFLARWIDVFTSSVIAYITLISMTIFVSIITYALGGDTRGDAVTRFLTSQSLSEIIFTMAAYAVYHAVAEHISGVTLGKWITGLAVVSEDGTRPCLRQTLMRNGWWAYAESINFGQPAISHMYSSPRRQRNGDIAASTMVVKRRSLPPESAPTLLNILFGLLAGFTIAGAVYALSYLTRFL